MSTSTSDLTQLQTGGQNWPVFRPEVRAMHSYMVQDAKGMIKLDAMENPFALSTELKASLGQRLAEVALNRYPGARHDDLRQALAQHTQLPNGYELLLGNGSDELITLLSTATAIPGSVVIAPIPGFVMYQVSAQLQGQSFIGVSLTNTFELDTTAILAAVQQYHPALLYLAYPNNPTANLWNAADMLAIIEAVGQQKHGLVVIDEAYQPFSSHSFADQLTQYPHILLMRTLSKFGLAGVRLGYLIGRAELVGQIDKVRPPYNVSNLNCETALWALEHEQEFQRQAMIIKQERSRLLNLLQTLPAVSTYPSEANMFLLRVPDAKHTFTQLKTAGILVKNLSGQHPLLDNCLRISIGLPEENDAFLAALRNILA